MLRRIVLASLALAVVAGAGVAERDARANGRLPATSTITFRQGHETDIAVGLTFGLLLSHDGGKTWAWICEAAVGYGGMYDPTYAYSPSGALFATTFNGLTVARNSCTFDPTPEGGNFVSTSALGPGGEFYFAAAQIADTNHGVPADFKIYKSLNDGMTLPAGIKPGDPADVNVWWQSILVAPSSPKVVYLSGYRYIPNPAGAGTVRDQLLFRSDDAGASWTKLPGTGFVLKPNSLIHIVGVWSNNPSHVYARVEFIDNTQTDALYVSSNAGLDWTEIDRAPNPLGAFVVRAAANPAAQGNHDLIAGNAATPVRISHDDGKTWTPLANAPHLSCLVENSAGELWACTQNYGVGMTPSDDAGIMKTTDLVTWTKVLRYQDLTDAATCAAGTKQHDMCAPTWCAVCAQLGCKPSASYACPVPTEAPRPSKGCNTGASTGGLLALVLAVATLLRRRRRRDS